MEKKIKSTKKTEEARSESSLFDYLRFGESYTSLILGIVVVIISTILLLSFINNKNANKSKTPNLQQTQIISQLSPTLTPTPSVFVTKAPTSTPKSTLEPTLKPTAVPTKIATATLAPTAKVSIMPKKVLEKPIAITSKDGKYVIMKGDTLWSIAEKTYKNGYNWVDIARVNKLNNSDVIQPGSKLILPKIKSKPTTLVSDKVSQKKVAINKVDQKNKRAIELQYGGEKITGAQYEVVKGDNLWNISVRAYGDGYQWVKIAKANNLVNPNIIHPGNKLSIPRIK